MCGSKISTYTGCNHTLKTPFECRPVHDSGQSLCRDWDHSSREYTQALPQNCPRCDRGGQLRSIDPSRWREIGTQLQEPLFIRRGGVADRYVPTPPPPPHVSEHSSGFRHVEDQTGAGAGGDSTLSEIDRRVLDWGRDVPHPTGFDTRYTPPSHANDVYRRSSSQESIHFSSRAEGSAPRQHHHHRHRSSRADNSTHHQPSSSSRFGSSASNHHRSRTGEHTSRQPSNGTQLYNTPCQPSPRAESLTAHAPSIGGQQVVIPRRRLDVGQVYHRYENADDYSRHLSEQHGNSNQLSRTLPMHPHPPVRLAPPSLPSAADSSRAQSIYRAAPQPEQQPESHPRQQPDPGNTGTDITTNGGTVGGTSPTAVRRGAGTHGGSGGMSYPRGPAPGPGASRRIF